MYFFHILKISTDFTSHWHVEYDTDQWCCLIFV